MTPNKNTVGVILNGPATFVGQWYFIVAVVANNVFALMSCRVVQARPWRGSDELTQSIEPNTAE